MASDRTRVPLGRPRQRAAVRLYNSLARACGRDRLRRDDFALEALHAAAVRRAGSDDFGAPSYLAPLEVWIEALLDTAELHAFGRLFARQMIVALLETRLRVEQAFAQDPLAGHERIQRPLIVVGMPRTGTTFLLNVLAADPSHRPLATWEAMFPAAPDRGAADRQRRLAARLLAVQAYLTPHMRHVHATHLDGPEECTSLLLCEFACVAQANMAHVPAFADWLFGQDHLAGMRYHERQLQLLQRRERGERWLLKSPTHMLTLQALLEVYPDACIVFTHRDPAEAVPSLCSLNAVFHGLWARRVDGPRLGAETVRILDRCHAAALETRRRHGDERFADVDHDELVADPLGTLRRLYAHFALPFDDALERRFADRIAANPRHVHGVHQYTPEAFGLSAGALRERYGERL